MHSLPDSTPPPEPSQDKNAAIPVTSFPIVFPIVFPVVFPVVSEEHVHLPGSPKERFRRGGNAIPDGTSTLEILFIGFSLCVQLDGTVSSCGQMCIEQVPS